MAYLGNKPATSFTKATKDTFSGDGSTTAFTLSKIATTNDVEVFVENVQQEPTSAYGISGTTLTFTAAPPSGTSNVYVIHRSPAIQTVTHPSNQNLQAVDGKFTGVLKTDTIKKADGTGSITVPADSGTVVVKDGSNDITVNDITAGGIYLGGTGAANYLDDYEEGTWTPSLIGSTSDPSGTYSNQSGKYTKTGNKVFAQFQLVLNSGFSNGSGQIRVSGLPFNSNFETMTGNVALEEFSDKVDNHCTPVMANGSSQVRFLSMNLSGGWSYIQWGDNTSATLYVFGSVSYTTDS